MEPAPSGLVVPTVVTATTMKSSGSGYQPLSTPPTNPVLNVWMRAKWQCPFLAHSGHWVADAADDICSIGRIFHVALPFGDAFVSFSVRIV